MFFWITRLKKNNIFCSVNILQLILKHSTERGQLQPENWNKWRSAGSVQSCGQYKEEMVYVICRLIASQFICRGTMASKAPGNVNFHRHAFGVCNSPSFTTTIKCFGFLFNTGQKSICDALVCGGYISELVWGPMLLKAIFTLITIITFLAECTSHVIH